MEVMTMVTGKGDNFVAETEVMDTDGAIWASVKDRRIEVVLIEC